MKEEKKECFLKEKLEALDCEIQMIFDLIATASEIEVNSSTGLKMSSHGLVLGSKTALTGRTLPAI